MLYDKIYIIYITRFWNCYYLWTKDLFE